MPVIVQVKPTPKTDAETAEEQRQKAQQSSDRNWTRGLAIVTALVGFLQLVAIGFQVGLLFRQNNLFEGQNQIMAAQSGIMANQLTEATKAANAGDKTAQAAVDAIILTHRPKIVVRNIVVPKLEPGHIPGKFGGTIWATNIGNTPAQVIRVRAEWLVTDRLPMRNPVVARSAVKSKLRNIPISAGRSVALKLPSRQVEQVEAGQLLGVNGRWRYALYLVGLIKYFDAGRQLRRTAFCRKWNPETGRFEIVKDDDYEHAD